jgi:predicted outer membrane repeat protein
MRVSLLLLLVACRTPVDTPLNGITSFDSNDTGLDSGDSGRDSTDSGSDSADSAADTGDSSSGPVDADGDGYDTTTDCDDTDARVHPGAEEVCDGLDDDCDGLVDEALGSDWYPDADGDGYGDAGATPTATCTPDVAWVEDHTDCDDTNPAVHPGAKEILCDSIDNDCDGAGADSVAMLDGLEYTDLQDAIDVAPDGSIVYVCLGTHNVTLTVNDARTLTIAGISGDATATVLTGGDAHRILYVAGGANVTVKDLTFEHGRAEYAYDLVARGGAIVVLESDFSALDCTFSENTATTTDGDGGALFFYNESGLSGSVELSGCTFEANEAHFDGGAASLRGVATVSDCRFADNAADLGGALYFDTEGVTGDSPAVISGSTFESNEGSGFGGAIFGGSVVVDGSTFTGNGGDNVYGGAIKAASLAITDSTFDGNLGRYGGAIDAYAGSGATVVLSILGSSFTGQYAGQGAAVLVMSSPVEMRIEDTVFDSGTANYGGAIEMWGVESLTASFEATDFLSNTASDEGGAIYVVTDGPVTMTFEGGVISGNTAGGDGGLALFASEASTGTTQSYSFVGTLISDNSSTYERAGFLTAEVDSPSDVSVSFTSCTLTGNASVGSYGAILAYGATVTSIETDWGTGKTDNVPCDLTYVSDAGFTSYCDLGSSETFTCDTEGSCE